MDRSEPVKYLRWQNSNWKYNNLNIFFLIQVPTLKSSKPKISKIEIADVRFVPL